ncbi:MAG: hypothetical protein ACKO3H_07620 [Verrucomicrobiota bacterium]
MAGRTHFRPGSLTRPLSGQYRQLRIPCGTANFNRLLLEVGLPLVTAGYGLEFSALHNPEIS